MAVRKKTTTKRKAAPKRRSVTKKPVVKGRVAVPKKTTPQPEPEVQPQTDVVENTVPSESEEPTPKSILEPEASSEEANEQVESAPELKQTEEKVPDGRSTKIYVISIIISIIILAVASGIFIYRSQQNMEEVSMPSPTPEEKVVEEVETVKAMEKKDVTLEILNGSGVAGLAGDTSDIFKELGYEVKEVGNTAATEGNQLYISNKYSEEELANLIADAKEKLDVPGVAAKLSDLDVAARIVLGR